MTIISIWYVWAPIVNSVYEEPDSAPALAEGSVTLFPHERPTREVRTRYVGLRGMMKASVGWSRSIGSTANPMASLSSRFAGWSASLTDRTW